MHTEDLLKYYPTYEYIQYMEPTHLYLHLAFTFFDIIVVLLVHFCCFLPAAARRSVTFLTQL